MCINEMRRLGEVHRLVVREGARCTSSGAAARFRSQAGIQGCNCCSSGGIRSVSVRTPIQTANKQAVKPNGSYIVSALIAEANKAAAVFDKIRNSLRDEAVSTATSGRDRYILLLQLLLLLTLHLLQEARAGAPAAHGRTHGMPCSVSRETIDEATS